MSNHLCVSIDTPIEEDFAMLSFGSNATHAIERSFESRLSYVNYLLHFEYQFAKNSRHGDLRNYLPSLPTSPILLIVALFKHTNYRFTHL